MPQTRLMDLKFDSWTWLIMKTWNLVREFSLKPSWEFFFLFFSFEGDSNDPNWLPWTAEFTSISLSSSQSFYFQVTKDIYGQQVRADIYLCAFCFGFTSSSRKFAFRIETSHGDSWIDNIHKFPTLLVVLFA